MIADREWRTTTATRVFALALVVGASLRAPLPAPPVLGCLTLAVCAVDLQPGWHRRTWPTVAEAALAALVASAPGAHPTALIYVAVVTVVAGYRHGGRGALLAGAASGAVLAAAGSAAPPGALVLCGTTGVGGGLLMAHQRRWLRDLETAQAPHAAAYRTMTELHGLATRVGFDLRADDVVARLASDLRAASGQEGRMSLAVSVRTDGGASETLLDEDPAGPEQAVLPARVGDQHFGEVVVRSQQPLAPATVRRLQAIVDEQAIRLDGALLLEGVRRLATREERLRLARDLHDGAAQRVTGARLLAEDLADALGGSDRDEAATAARLRTALDDAVTDLRCALLDLHHEVGAEGLATSLAELVRGLGRHSALRLHLTLDEHGARLRRSDEEQILRIAQEAIANARRHAAALNLWVRLVRRDGYLLLLVEDDGVGSATPRPGHYGLRTMAGRAGRLDGRLDVLPRPDGGTVVRFEIGRPPESTINPVPEGVRHAHRVAGR